MSTVQSADDVLAEANSLFVDEDYEAALKKFDEAIEMEGNNSDYYAKRSFCYYKLSDFQSALKDANKSVEVDSKNSNAHLRKGMAAFALEDFKTAFVAFTTSNELKPSAQIKTWLRKCEAELGDTTPVQPVQATKPVATPVVAPTPTPAPAPTPSATLDPSKIRHEWFQTPTHVTVCVMAKQTKKENLTVQILPKELSVTIKLPHSEYQLSLELAGTIIPEESNYELLSTKVEIRMKKSEAVQWKTLENTGEKLEAWGTVQDGPSKGLAYPSSAKRKADWDHIPVEEDKLEGDAALNQVFSGIFKNASDEQRMAMQKSFLESGGTVLSTNWDEVGKGEVKGSAPNGMVMKKWSELTHDT